MLALIGIYFSDRLEETIDARIAKKLAIPSALMSAGYLNLSSAEDRPLLTDLLYINVIDTFVLGPDGLVTHSGDVQKYGKHYLKYLSRKEKQEFSPVGKTYRQVEFISSEGRRVVSSLGPITINEEHVGSLYIRIDGDQIASLKSNVLQLFFVCALVAVVISTILLTLIVNRTVVPRIRKTSEVLRRIADGDFSARITNSGTNDQLGIMMEQVNVMISTIQNYTRKLQILNTAAEGFAHARTKDEIIIQATDLIEQQLPVKREDSSPYVTHEDSSFAAINQETVFTLPVTDDEKNYQVLAFVAAEEFRPLGSVEKDFVETLSRMVNVATDRIAAFQDITNAEARYRHLFTSALEGILRTLPEGRIIEANPALALMTGYESVEDLIEQVTDIGQQVYVDPLDFEQLKSQLDTEERLLDREVRLKRKDGSIFPVSLSAYTVRDEAGKLQAFDIRLFNIAERKRREQAERDHLAAEAVSIAKSKLVDDLEWKNRQLVEALNELKATQMQLMQSEKMAAVGMTAGGVAHDLNNILAGLVSYPELLLDSLPDDNKIRGQIEAILESGKRAAAIVADLLTLTQGIVKEKLKVPLETVIGEYLLSNEFRNFIGGFPGVEVATDFTPDTSSILCSPVHIEKAVMNLVTNSVEAMSGHGRIIIGTGTALSHRGVDASGEDTVDKLAVLTVTDDGPGIPKENIKHIFEPFYTRKVLGLSGTGLGLTVVWNVVNEHNGSVEVNSTDEGTSFTLYFPVDDQTYPQVEDSPVVRAGAELEGKGRILVIDDEPLQRDIAQKMLERFGYEVECCRSGEEAVTFLETEKVDLLLLDMLMPPGINGLETYRRILKMHPNQKAIIVSGYSENKDVKLAMQLGAGAFVKKPYAMHQIAQSVKNELETFRA